jgi:hypothetical protein
VKGRIWIELQRAPEYDDGDTLAYTWAWGYWDDPRRHTCRVVDELIVREASGGITYAGEPYSRNCAVPVMCLLANHIRNTGEVPDRLSYVAPEIRPTPPIPEPRNVRRGPSPRGGGLGLGNLGERARRSHH